MKLKTPFTIPNRKFIEIDLIRHAFNSKKSLQLRDFIMTIEKCLNLILV